MKFYSKFTLLVFAAFIQGCGSGIGGSPEIEGVKRSFLAGYDSFSIGEAFDHRQACDNTSWSMTKTESGRSLVEYRCKFKGVDEHYKKQLDQEIEQVIKKGDEAIAKLNDRAEWLRKDIEQKTKNVLETKTKLETAKEEGPREDEIVAGYRSLLAIVSSPNIMDNLDLIEDYLLEPRPNSLKGKYSHYKRRKAQLEESGNNPEYEGSYLFAKRELEKELGYLAESLRSDIKRESTRTTAAYNRNINDLEGYLSRTTSMLESSKEELARLESGDEVRAGKQFVEDVISNMKAIDRRVNAEEFFQFSVSETRFDIIHSGIEYTYSSGKTEINEYSWEGHASGAVALAIIYEDKVTDYVTFLGARAGKSWGQLLGY